MNEERLENGEIKQIEINIDQIKETRKRNRGLTEIDENKRKENVQFHLRKQPSTNFPNPLFKEFAGTLLK